MKLRAGPESLLESHEFTLHVDEATGLEELGFTDQNKANVARMVMLACEQHGLELDPTKSAVRLIIRETGPSKITHKDRPCIDLIGLVLFFTTKGPQRFDYKFTIPLENTHIAGTSGEA